MAYRRRRSRHSQRVEAAFGIYKLLAALIFALVFTLIVAGSMKNPSLENALRPFIIFFLVAIVAVFLIIVLVWLARRNTSKEKTSKQLGGAVYVNHGRMARGGDVTESEHLGDDGEDDVRAILGDLDAANYFSYHDILLPSRRGETQIDHLLISKYGIFVVETKNYADWIFGRATDKTWTQVKYKRKTRFQNPIHQNYKHIKAVEEYCGVSPQQIVGVVVFTAEGKCEFKTPMPDNVIFIGGLRDFIERRTATLLDADQLTRVIKRIDRATGFARR